MSPGNAGKLYTDVNSFKAVKVASGTNVVGYTVNATQDHACIWTSRVYSSTDIVSYKLDTDTGKIVEGVCADLGSSYVSDGSTIASWQSAGTSTASPTSTPTATSTPSAGATVANCGSSTYTVTGPATVTCALASSTAGSANYTITVTGTSSTPALWTVKADWTGVANFASAKGYAATAFDDTGAITAKTYTFSGTDRSYNHDTAAANNYAYTSSSKTPIVFTSQLVYK